MLVCETMNGIHADMLDLAVSKFSQDTTQSRKLRSRRIWTIATQPFVTDEHCKRTHGKILEPREISSLEKALMAEIEILFSV